MSHPAKSHFSQIPKKLQAVGYRWTRPRQQVLDAFQNNPKPMTIQEAFAKIGGKHLDLASVYRTVHLFLKHGVVVAVDTVAVGRRFELSDDYRDHHHHLMCQVCGRVEDLQDCSLGSLEVRIARMTRYKITHHDLKFVGLCADCQ